MPRESPHNDSLPIWRWVTDYADVGPCIEMIAAQGTLKKNDNFINFAVDVAQRILGSSLTVSWGKWGARLERQLNPDVSKEGLELAANKVRLHPSWIGLMLAAHVFEHGGGE